MYPSPSNDATHSPSKRDYKTLRTMEPVTTRGPAMTVVLGLVFFFVYFLFLFLWMDYRQFGCRVGPQCRRSPRRHASRRASNHHHPSKAVTRDADTANCHRQSRATSGDGEDRRGQARATNYPLSNHSRGTSTFLTTLIHRLSGRSHVLAWRTSRRRRYRLDVGVVLRSRHV